MLRAQSTRRPDSETVRQPACGRRGRGRESNIEDRGSHRGSRIASNIVVRSSIQIPHSSFLDLQSASIQCFILKTSPQFAPAIFFARGLNLTRQDNIGSYRSATSRLTTDSRTVRSFKS